MVVLLPGARHAPVPGADDDAPHAATAGGDTAEVRCLVDALDGPRRGAGAGIGIGLDQPVSPQPRTALEPLDQRGACRADRARGRRVGDT